jgi:hypothetical protein
MPARHRAPHGGPGSARRGSQRGHGADDGRERPEGAAGATRKHVGHETPKNFPLDLFTPDDGHFEYSAVATNLALDLPALYAFICGRQQVSVLAHNLVRSFQLDTMAVPKPRSRKRTYSYLIRSMRTLRFLLVTRAGRVTRIGGRHVLRLSHNPATEAFYASIDHRLAA